MDLAEHGSLKEEIKKKKTLSDEIMNKFSEEEIMNLYI
jgi:hypothetical protein